MSWDIEMCIETMNFKIVFLKSKGEKNSKVWKINSRERERKNCYGLGEL